MDSVLLSVPYDMKLVVSTIICSNILKRRMPVILDAVIICFICIVVLIEMLKMFCTIT